MELHILQEERWRRIVGKWEKISRGQKCIVIGDLNLDHLRWVNPESHLERMVEDIKEFIETSGFQQLISNYTRSWNMQADSCLDHTWSNCQLRTISTFNEDRASSNHNVIGIDISLKDIKVGGHNIIKRMWKDFDAKKFVENLKLLDWSSILLEDNVDVANSLIEDLLNSVIDTLAPMRMIQVRTWFNNWISDSTKLDMKSRDQARNKARQSSCEEDWSIYRQLRNTCTANQKRDKAKHLSDLYGVIEENRDSANLFLGLRKAGPPSFFRGAPGWK